MTAGDLTRALRVGIANPFAYRPHVAHDVFLARQLERLGATLFYLQCGGDLADCNSRANKRGLAHKLECYKCRLGGIRSYLDVRPDRLDIEVPLDDALLEQGAALAYSTTATALQVEHRDETAAADFKAMQRGLGPGAATAYVNTRRWIRERQLDCVFVFNGRFDLTRAVVEACRAEGIRFVSVERSWFGEGLQLLPGENCLGLQAFRELGARWRDRPLTRQQALMANRLITRRLTRTSVGEWRQYNTTNTGDFEGRRIRFLFLPSSQHEWLGTPDRASGWHHPIEGLEYLFARMGVPLSELVVRGHPGWAMRIRHYGRNRADNFYREWTQRVGAQYIEASRTVDSHALMKATDLVLLNGSSASMEAAWLGKPLVTFVPSAFSTSGFARDLLSRADVDALGAAEIDALRRGGAAAGDPFTQCRQVLRYIYCVNYRLMQFTDCIRSRSPYVFECSDPTDLSRLESLVRDGVLRESDASFAEDPADERQVVEAILAGQGLGLEPAIVPPPAGARPIPRRPGYSLLDSLTK